MILDSQHQESIATPRSYCPQSKATLRWYHLIPVISFLLLRGRCTRCGQSISWQYPLIELLTALTSAVSVYCFYPSVLQCVAAVLFCWITIPLLAIDFKEQLLPDSLNYLLLWCGLGFSLANTFITPYNAITGALVAFILLWLIQWLYEAFAKKPGLGGGDVKLFAAMGAWLGWQPLFQLMTLSGILALTTVSVLIFLKKHQTGNYFAFGPFIIIAGWVILLMH